MKVLFCMLAVAVLSMQALQETKASSFSNILSLDKAAVAARHAELNDKNEQTTAKRRIAYEAAAKAAKSYIIKWESGETVSNLRAHYRLATYLDYADATSEALVEYEVCKNHPKLQDIDAVWNDQPLAQLVDERIAAIRTSTHIAGPNISPVKPNDPVATSQSVTPSKDPNVKSHSEGEGRTKPPIP